MDSIQKIPAFIRTSCVALGVLCLVEFSSGSIVSHHAADSNTQCYVEYIQHTLCRYFDFTDGMSSNVSVPESTGGTIDDYTGLLRHYNDKNVLQFDVSVEKYLNIKEKLSFISIQWRHVCDPESELSNMS